MGIKGSNVFFKHLSNVLCILLSADFHVVGAIDNVENGTTIWCRHQDVHEWHSLYSGTIPKETHAIDIDILGNVFLVPVTKEMKVG